MRDRIERLVAALCSDECAGRAPGTRGGLLAREHVREALVAAGLRAEDQPIRGVNGANLICELEGSGPLADRAVVIGAHYDHLGSGPSGEIYRGADDNAAAVAVLVEAGRILASERGPRRRIVVAAFDTEEPPHFLEGTMGSEVLAASGRLALDRVDLVVAMDLVGHAVGQDGFPSAVRESLFVLGAEKSAGTAALVDGAARGIAGLRARRLDADVIPPLSDYEPFWRRRVPFVFLTCGRSRVYHTPLDTPDLLDLAKIEATARFLAALARDAALAPGKRVYADARDDAGTLATLGELASTLAPFSLDAERAEKTVRELQAAARKRPLSERERGAISSLIIGLEEAFA